MQSQRQAVAEAEERHRVAKREVRTVEKLEEKHDAEQRMVELRAEQTVLDELAGRMRAADEAEGER